MHPDKIPKLLHELIKNSRRSDRDLAKALGFSQPTVTRTRRQLEEEKYVLQYTTLPDFTKLGFELVAYTFTLWPPDEKEEAASPHKRLEKDPRVIFVAEGNGLGENSIIITVHKNYTDYSNFFADLQKTKNVHHVNSFIATFAGIKKQFTLTGLEKA